MLKVLAALAVVAGVAAFVVVDAMAPDAPKPNVKGEIVALRGTKARSLLHPIGRISAVYGFSRSGKRVDFAAGVDYVQAGDGIARTPGSAIYNFDDYAIDMNPDGATFAWVDQPRSPPVVLFKHVYVDYVANVEPVTIPALAPVPVTGLVLVAGDSITGASHVVGGEGYYSLLRKHFGDRLKLEGISKGGSALGYLVDELPGLLAKDPPSAIIIAFGMNDHRLGRAHLDRFRADLIKSVDSIKAAGARAILVGFFRKNAAWDGFSLENVLMYNSAIEEVAKATGSAFVDIDAIWQRAKAAGKSDLELLGDNFHHPSNFGQRLYFSAILPHLLTEPISSDGVPDYVIVPAAGETAS